MLAALAALLLENRILDCLVTHRVVACAAEGQSFMHPDHNSAYGVIVVSAFEDAIEPVQLFTREDAYRVVEVNEVNLTTDPVVVRRGGQIRSSSNFAARPGLGSGNLRHIL